MASGGFSNYLEDIFNSPTFSDVTIILDNDADDVGGTESFYGHRVVLATMSDYFKTMLFGSFMEAGQREIRLNDVPYSAFKRCMRFAYFGWNESFEEMTVDEAVQFYSLSRMLLLDAKIKSHYVPWMRSNIVKWEKDIWTLYLSAMEFNMSVLAEECFWHFTDIANECLALDSFGNVPLQLVKKIVDCKAMNCTKTELRKAVHYWITLNNPILKDADRLLLLHGVESRNTKCFKGQKFPLYDKEQKKKYLATKPDYLPLVPQDPTNSFQLYFYHSRLNFNKCVNLTGIRFVLESNKGSSDPSYEKTRSEMDIRIEITYANSLKHYNCRDTSDCGMLCIRNVHLVYDFTQSDINKVNLFFKAIRCCARNQVTIKFSWWAAGIQPIFRTFGEFQTELVSGDKSIVSHLFYTNILSNFFGRCGHCPWFSDEDSDAEMPPWNYHNYRTETDEEDDDIY